MKHIIITTIAAVLLVGTAFAAPIHTAAKNGNVAGVQAELDKGVDVNASGNGQSPLHLAAIIARQWARWCRKVCHTTKLSSSTMDLEVSRQ